MSKSSKAVRAAFTQRAREEDRRAQHDFECSVVCATDLGLDPNLDDLGSVRGGGGSMACFSLDVEPEDLEMYIEDSDEQAREPDD